MQRQRLVRSPQIDPPHVERDTRAHPGLAVLRVSRIARDVQQNRRCAVDLAGRRPSRLRLQSKAVGHIPAPRFGELQHHILQRIVAVRILHRRIHLVEQRQPVQPPLRVQHRALVQRIARMHCHLLAHHVRPGMHHARQQHLVHKHLLPLRHVHGHVRLLRIAARSLLLHIHVRLGKSMAQVVVQDRVAITGERNQRIGLPLLRVQQRLHILFPAAVHACQRHRAKLLLRPFSDRHHHRNLRHLQLLAALRCVHVRGCGGDRRLVKSVRPVQAQNRCLIRLHQLRRVAPVAQVQVRLRHLHPFLQQVALKVLVANNRY